VLIGKREVGDDAPCFITFEAGPTHNGVESAKALIDAAANAGADAIKFQIFDPGRLVSDRQLPFCYTRLVDERSGQTEEVTEPLYDILLRRYLKKSEWIEVKAHADAQDLEFFATVGFPEDIALVNELGCQSIKIASADVDHAPLIRDAALTGMSIQLDTGNATLGELENAVDICHAVGNRDVVIHQCPSGYPARLESIQLNMIPTLRRVFPECVIAYSDHTPDHDMDIGAVALGAQLVEKTITLDKTQRSPEHIMSLEPAEMRDFVRRIRELETALGGTRRALDSHQRNSRKAMRRSVHIAEDLVPGNKLSEGVLDYRRPGDGIPIDSLPRILGRTLRVSKARGDRLDWADIDWS
jgi:sialic acid synthase SpsE